MILGTLSSWDEHRVVEHPVIVEAIEALMKIVQSNPEPGRYEINGDQIYVNVMELNAKSLADQLAEKHEDYIDVHYLIEGNEMIGWAPLQAGIEPVKPYDSEGDYAIYAPSQDEVLLPLKPGMFTVFFPHDIHRPGMGPEGKIKKAVIKIHMDVLKKS